jgi:predicted O-linked N-acetylglucosamine transferase (SPINDLY family)
MTRALLEQAAQLHRAGRDGEADAICRQILQTEPANVDAMQLLGILEFCQGRGDAGLELLQRAVALQPNRADFHHNIGFALGNMGRHREALAFYRKALALKPDLADALHHLADTHNVLEEWEEAITAYQRAIALKPDRAESFNNLGAAFANTHRWDEAIAAYQQALAMRPDFPEAHNNLGDALKNIGRLDLALTSFDKALALRPVYRAAADNRVLAMPYLPGTDARQIHQAQLDWNQRFAAPLAKFIRQHRNDRDPDRRLRIGYASSDFRMHASFLFLRPMLINHDHEKFDITIYSQTRSPDWMTEEFRKYPDRWRDTLRMSDEQMAEQIRADQIDILIDCKLHTFGNRMTVFARKPAPIQITFMGYPGCSGLPTMDYHLADENLEEPGAGHAIGEPAIYLPNCFWCFDPMTEDPPVNDLPAAAAGFVTFGSLNATTKLNDPVLRLWARVMREVKDSRILLLAPPGSARQRVVDLMRNENIEPRRIRFVARQQRDAYLKQHHEIDIGLDTFPYNGHTTSLDANWMGVPVITLVGNTAPGRVGWMHSVNLHLSELAATTKDQFVQVAADLAMDLPRLQQLRSSLRQRLRESPLMDARGYIRNLEAAYRQIWKKWCAGK